MEKVTIGNAELYHGDCMEILPMLGKVDAVITDPPYGQNIAATPTVGANSKERIESGPRDSYDGSAGSMNCTIYPVSDWDEHPMSSEEWAAISAHAKILVGFGFNRLANVYGPCPKMLIWDKKTKNGWNDTFADAEVAWTNSNGPTRILRHLWVGGLRASEKQVGDKVHPAQKPISVMKWCMDQVKVPLTGTILDPYMGSGTTGVAAMESNRKFIGIEIDQKYFDIACKRIEAAQQQLHLFGA